MQAVASGVSDEEGNELTTFIYTRSAVQVVRQISDVKGAAVLDDELYVLTDAQSLRVYNIASLELVQAIGLKYLSDPFDIAACSHNKTIYISDPYVQRLFRIDKKENKSYSVTLARGKPFGLSVTKSHTLLITLLNSRAVIEMKNEKQIRQINLDATIISPVKTIEIGNGIYAVSHGLHTESPLHRICLVDDKGSIQSSYGSTKGADIGHLSFPAFMAFDFIDSIIYVADLNNERILLFDTSLKLLGNLALPFGFTDLSSVQFDQSNRKLLIADGYCLLSVSVPSATVYKPLSTQTSTTPSNYSAVRLQKSFSTQKSTTSSKAAGLLRQVSSTSAANLASLSALDDKTLAQTIQQQQTSTKSTHVPKSACCAIL